MLEHEAVISKLQEFFREKNFQLNNEEIEKMSSQLIGLAFFLVHFHVKKNSKFLEQVSFELPAENSP